VSSRVPRRHTLESPRFELLMMKGREESSGAFALLRLVYRRRILRMTQRELAARAGLDQPLLSRIETERIRPNDRELAVLAKILGVDDPQALITQVRDALFDKEEDYDVQVVVTEEK
jgi:transcriptional regulator with XRE-family HTH domain